MILLILLVAHFVLLVLTFLLFLFDILKLKKKSKEGSKREGLSKLSGYSYGMGILALLLLMFVGALLST